MRDGCCRPGLSQESEVSLLVTHEVGRENLQRHRPAQIGVLGAVDYTHPAFADLGEAAEVGEGFANHSITFK